MTTFPSAARPSNQAICCANSIAGVNHDFLLDFENINIIFKKNMYMLEVLNDSFKRESLSEKNLPSSNQLSRRDIFVIKYCVAKTLHLSCELSFAALKSIVNEQSPKSSLESLYVQTIIQTNEIALFFIRKDMEKIGRSMSNFLVMPVVEDLD